MYAAVVTLSIDPAQAPAAAAAFTSELLKRNGIETLRFTEDRLVTDPELEQAIVRSVKKTLGLECPDSVWVDVA